MTVINEGATCAITSSRGPTTTPGGSGCANFQTTAVPTFVNTAVNNYHMTSISPLIDMGNPLAPAARARSTSTANATGARRQLRRNRPA